MSFFCLKGVERFLTTIADQIGRDYPAQMQRNAVPIAGISALTQSSEVRVLASPPSQQHVDDVARRSSGDINLVPVSNVSMPLNISSEADFYSYYSTLLNSLRIELAENIIPSIPNHMREDLITALQQELSAQIIVQDAEAALEKCRKQAEVDDEAKANLEQMQFLLQQSEDAALAIGSQVLNLVDTHMTHLKAENNTGGKDWQSSLFQCVILTSATPKKLASYAAQGGSQAAQIYNLLQSAALMKEILSSDGPKQQNYASMLHIYSDILAGIDGGGASSKDNIFHRLALAVALEYSSPIKIFDTEMFIDPIERYKHYECAYQRGELDSCFSSLSVWELRMVVNNDASDDEIRWCRDMLRNYRPDHILDRNDQWKYCMIVKSDVRYKRPEWAPHCPRTYKQLISGGGMCGPRAWFGRFICKSFGIPTWGVRQPGHAAMSHWTSSGEWVICLGGPNWKKSYWEERNGVDFELETKARMRGRTEYEKILWLDCFAVVNEEFKIGSQQRKYHKRNIEQRVWHELALLHKRLLSTCSLTEQERLQRVKNMDQDTTLVDMLLQKDMQSEQCTQDVNGVINIPATSCCRPIKSHPQVIFMKSFLKEGGNQIHLREDGDLEYRVIVNSTQTYLLRARIVTIHSDCKPLQLTLNGVSEQHYKIKVPYTEGEWAETIPIQVVLDRGVNNFHFYRAEAGLGLTIKKFILVPVESKR